ncbi:Disease resistance-like protein DSC1 [Citrus sinensis]|uniref:Disease resistance-like protein DSC1 n=1 Tax=Citrus sinensis TaxID=2711 RepID=A0ACB8MAV6_CITSI|nr:Disease resistance-like protein DSC1 [Citrus sinensis]
MTLTFLSKSSKKFLKKGESKSEESSRQESHIFHLLSVSFTKFASSMASSSSLTVQSKYEVFLSFRGEDTHISIIIFSKDYASSKWCLNEVVKILDCKKMNGQIVIPVFYQVDPSDVRKQRGTFEKAFVHNENNFPDKVQKWRDVLTEASNFSGYDSTESRKEAELAEKIVEDISKKLEDLCPTRSLHQHMYDTTDSDGFIGLNSRIEDMKSQLRLESHDVRIVGIWGMGGIGKTTIASVVFHQISRDFQGKCFMANVREQSNKMGVIHVRDEVISQVLGENLKIGTLTIPQNVRKRLWRMKVLIVLDDVHDEFTQLESLANGVGGFSPGSRIIITTRDKRVLDKCGVNSVYEVEQLTYNHALELFCRKAFRQINRSRDLLELSQEVVCYADGNPLALEVLGSSLYHKSKQQWKDKLNNLKLISEPSIYKVLKISYDELNSEVKEIFIDIACFFKGEDIDFMTRIHDDPMSIHDGLNILVSKSLITISDENELQMHDLLQEMGQTIVRQESAKEPGKRSRLWDHNDVCYVLKKNKGTDKVEGIFLDLSKINDIHLNSQAFANMSNLRLLKFYMPKHNDIPIMSSKLHLDQGLEYLPEELRYLHWHEYSLKMLPFDFEPENLIELNLPYSKVEQIWKGEKLWSFKLKYIDISHSQQLVRMLNLSETPNLERTNLLNCRDLAYVGSSIENFNNLSMLCFKGCESLRSFPRGIHFVSPITIDFSFCVNLTEFPQISGNIIELKLWYTAIEEVPSSIECSNPLQVLSFSGCRSLVTIPASILSSGLSSLDRLDLRGCGLTAIPQEIGCLSSLKELDICENNSESLPASIMQLSRLTYLYLSKCNMLLSLPELSLSLKWLDASNCKRLQSLPEIPSSLEEVDASVFEKLLKHSHYDENERAYVSSSIEFWFTNSMKLDDEANNKNLADSQLRIQHMAIASLRLFSELTEPCILKGPIIVLPGSEIPECFSNQSSGSQITLQLPQHCCQNLVGFALCAVLERSDSEWAEFDVGCRYSFEMKTLSGRKHVRRCCVMASYQITKIDHVMLGFRPCGNVGFPDDNLHTTVSFNFFSNSDNAVTCCGVCAVYANPNENKPNTFTLNFATESWKLDDMASASGTSDEEELEPSPKRICRDQINSP